MSKFIIEKVYQDLKDGIISTYSTTVETEGVWKDLGYTRLRLVKPRYGCSRYSCVLYRKSEKALHTQYARYLMALYKGELVDPHLDVDHINDKPLDDYIINLQILNKTNNYVKFLDHDLDRQSEILDKCVKDYREGLTYKEIANKNNIHIDTVVRYISKSGTQKRSNLVYKDKELEKEIIEEYLKSTLIEDIMEKFNTSHTVINRILNENNIEKRKTTRDEVDRRLENVESDVIEMHKNDVPLLEISRKKNIPDTVVRYIIKKNNLEYRHKPPTFISSDPELQKKAEELYLQNIPNKEIASRLNIGTDTLNYILNQRGVKKKRLALTDNERSQRSKEITDLFKSGVNLLDIAKKYGMTYNGVRKIVQRDPTYDDFLVKREENKQPTLSKEDKERKRIIEAKKNRDLLSKVLELKERSLSNREIGRQLGISHKVVKTYLDIKNLEWETIENINNGKLNMVVFTNPKKWIDIRDYVDKQIKKSGYIVPGKLDYFVEFESDTK